MIPLDATENKAIRPGDDSPSEPPPGNNSLTMMRVSIEHIGPFRSPMTVDPFLVSMPSRFCYAALAVG